jgi:hypothetical protein
VDELDFLAPEVSLSVQGKSGVKTKIGTVIFLLASFAFVGSIVFSAISFFRTDKPSISYETSSSSFYPKIDINKGYMIPMILPSYGGSTPIPFDQLGQYITIVARQIIQTNGKQPDGSFKSDFVVKPIKTARCGTLIGTGKIDTKAINNSLGVFAQSLYDTGVCLDFDPDTTFVEGTGNSNYFVGFDLNIFPCSLADSSQCKSKSQMKSFGFVYLVGQESLNLGTYEEPLSYSFNGDEFYYIDPALITSASLKTMETEIWDQKGFFQAESLRISYPKVEISMPRVQTRDSNKVACTKEEIDTVVQCSPYFNRFWISGGTKTKITRTYKSIVETFGDIGGARDTIFMIAMLLYG